MLHTYLDAREATSTQDPVFLSETGTALSVRSIQSLITELARRAHLSRILHGCCRDPNVSLYSPQNRA